MALEKILKNSSGVPTGEYERIAGGTLYADSPIGTILPYGGATAPSGWFLCQGQAISRTDYSELFAVIGTAFGSGDGSTTFNIPDLRGEFLRGAGTNSHSEEGSGGSVGTHQGATRVPNIYLSGGSSLLVTPDQNSGWGNTDSAYGNSTGYKAAGVSKQGESVIPLSYSTRPTNTSVNYIIKAKMVGVPADFMAKVDEAVGYVYQTSDVEGEYDANDFAVVGKTTRYCVKSPVHGYQVDGTAWWGFYETVCFRGGGYGYQTFRTMLGTPVMAIRQLYNGSWGAWQKLVTESDLSYLSRDKLMYHQETGTSVLYNVAYNWQLPINNTDLVHVTASDKNSPADNYDGIIKFTYGGVGAITNIGHYQLSGTGKIDATNSFGTLQFSFVNGLPEVCVAFLG